MSQTSKIIEFQTALYNALTSSSFFGTIEICTTIPLQIHYPFVQIASINCKRDGHRKSIIECDIFVNTKYNGFNQALQIMENIINLLEVNQFAPFFTSNQLLSSVQAQTTVEVNNRQFCIAKLQTVFSVA